MRDGSLLAAPAFAAALVALGIGGLSAQQPAPAATGSLKVTVKYTGPGQVNKTHPIWIWAFDTPEIGPDSVPIATQTVAESGGVASFSGLIPRVWLAVAYDEKGGYDGNSAPPPSGTPVWVHAIDGQSVAVETGPDAAVTLTFDDKMRMP
jgi:hypothetical protein